MGKVSKKRVEAGKKQASPIVTQAKVSAWKKPKTSFPAFRKSDAKTIREIDTTRYSYILSGEKCLLKQVKWLEKTLLNRQFRKISIKLPSLSFSKTSSINVPSIYQKSCLRNANNAHNTSIEVYHKKTPHKARKRVW